MWSVPTAGPSEITVVADKKSETENVVTSLIGQAEHDTNSQCIMISKDFVFLKQAQNDPFKVEDQVAIIYAGSKNLLKEVPVDKIKEFESEYIQLLNSKHGKILKEIKQGKLTDEVINTLEKVCNELSAKY